MNYTTGPLRRGGVPCPETACFAQGADAVSTSARRLTPTSSAAGAPGRHRRRPAPARTAPRRRPRATRCPRSRPCPTPHWPAPR